MDYFLKPVDSLSQLINEKAKKLYSELDTLPIEQFEITNSIVRDYLKDYHKQRSFFSVQTAAELLYRSIKQKGKALEDIVIMDYGAGVGSLYILAKMIGCKMVVYNDIMEDMTVAAKAVAEYLNVFIDLYITADHTKTLEILDAQGISCDIIVSRNVVEHIYDLEDFYGKMSVSQPNALIYFSTTANFHNPAMLMFHKRLHKRYETEYLPKRIQIIKEKVNGISDADLASLAAATRGLALHDLDDAIHDFKANKKLPDPNVHYSNTCNPENGVWAEHILPVKDYRSIIETKGYSLTVLPAFWDTHYHSKIKSAFGKAMNVLTRFLGDKGGLRTTAFIYIIAEKK